MTVSQYLLADRQWRAEHRLAHARYQLARAVTAKDIAFWQRVLEALVP